MTSAALSGSDEKAKGYKVKGQYRSIEEEEQLAKRGAARPDHLLEPASTEGKLIMT